MTAPAHALKYNGAPYNQDGTLANPNDTSITSGPGAALCACGVMSEELPNGAARRRWFKSHKETPVQAELPVEETQAEVEPDVDDLIGEPVKPKAKKAAAAAKKPAAKAKAAPKAKAAKAKPAPKADKAEHWSGEAQATIPFTTEVADSMWRFLGRDATKAMLDKLYPSINVKADAKTHAIVLDGTGADVEAATAEVNEFWAEAIEAVKVYKAEDKKFLARPKEGLEGRKASYFMVGEFYVNYATTYAAKHAA